MKTIEYRVGSGDTLYTIARRNKVSMEALARLNSLSDVHRIWAGQVLKIPEPLPPPTLEARTRNAKASGLKEPVTRTPKDVLSERGQEVGSFGRVSNDEGVNLRAAPGGAILKRLPFNTRVFVSREFPGD